MVIYGKAATKNMPADVSGNEWARTLLELNARKRVRERAGLALERDFLRVPEAKHGRVGVLAPSPSGVPLEGLYVESRSCHRVPVEAVEAVAHAPATRKQCHDTSVPLEGWGGQVSGSYGVPIEAVRPSGSYGVPIDPAAPRRSYGMAVEAASLNDSFDVPVDPAAPSGSHRMVIDATPPSGSRATVPTQTVPLRSGNTITDGN
jgi:hypothetical protein